MASVNTSGTIPPSSTSATSSGGPWPHGLSQGGLHDVAGGSFGDGFLGGFFGSVGSSLMSSPGFGNTFDTRSSRLFAAVVIGGTASELGGGKFGNGALSAAFVAMFNHQNQKNRNALGRSKNKSNQRKVGEIHITGHKVGKIGPMHTAIEYTDSTGTRWISAGPEDEKLVAGVGTLTNSVRETDAPSENIVLGVVKPPNNMTNDQYFKELVKATGNYGNNVDYDVFPGIMKSYNSNSFIGGIIEFTGGTSSIDISNFIGGNNPVPASYFTPKP